MTIRVSVVTPTYRRPGLLRRTLNALLAQDFPPDQYEIIVCDDAASEETRLLVERVCAEAEQAQWGSMAAPAPAYPGLEVNGTGAPAEQALAASELLWTTAPELPEVRYVAVAHAHGPAAARNCGWRAAQGEIIAFTDDDCLPAPGWLAAGAVAFERDALLVGVMGQTIVPLPPAPTDFELTCAGLERSEFITANCFYRRSALEAAGGFDERFTQAWREDSDLYFRLLDLYGSTRFAREPRALVLHPARPAPWGVSIGQQARARFNALLYRKHPHHYRKRLRPVTPWHYYGITAGLLTGLLGGAAGSEPLLAAGLLVWASLTARFVLRRLRYTAKTPSHIAEMVLTSLAIPPLALFWRWYGAVTHRVLFL